MIQNLRITVLSENTAGRRGVLAEHGLALWIEADETNILFDTGQGLVLAHNAAALEIDLAQADAVVLSHGHYDHTGGLESVLGRLGHAVVYVHPQAFEPKFGRWDDGVGRYIGSPIRDVEQLAPHVAQVVTTAGPTQVADGIRVSGEIPRRNGFEDTGGPFFLDEPCTQPDPLLDDQALYLETAEGLVVLTGCGHAGLVNTLHYACELTGLRRTYAVLGGFHLVQASDERLARTVEALHRYDVRRIGPAHCTGLAACAQILVAFPDRFVTLAAGKQVTLVSFRI